MPGGSASCLGVGHPGSGALPPPTARLFGLAAGAHYHLAVGAGGAGVGTRHEPHSARFCRLALRAAGAAPGRPGGAPLAWVWGVRGRALSLPRPLVPSGVRPGPTTHWLLVRGMRAWRPVTNPTTRALASWLCVLWGRHEGARGGGACCLGVRGGALSQPRPPVGWGVRPGPTTHWLWVRGMRAWGPVTNPTERALASWLCALWERHEGAPGGAPLAWVWGIRGRALSHPRPPLLWGGRPGPTTHWLWVRGVRAWGPVTNPTTRALACWLGARWERQEGARGGRLLPGCVASGDGRSPTPDHWSFRARGAYYPLAVGAGCRHGDPSQTPQRALLRAGLARFGRAMRLPLGGASCLDVGRPGSGALPPRTTRPFWACGRGPLPTCCGCGGCGRGDPSPTHSAHSCELALRAAGVARGRPGGAPCAWVWGARGRALSHPRPLVLSGVRPGPTTHWLWLRGVRAWGPVTNPTARALASWLCALLGRHEGARGGAPSAWASGVECSPTPDRPSFGACGRGPIPTGCGCGRCGRGDPSPTPQRALLRAGLARSGGGTRAPGGGASCLGAGRPGLVAVPALTTRPFGRAAGVHYTLAVDAGVAGVGTCHKPHSARSWKLALRAVGAA